MTKPVPLFRLALCAPRHWLAWLGLAAIWLTAQLPYSLLLKLGHALGRVISYLMHSRRRIAARNLELCFPKLCAAERKQLLDASMRDLGLLVAEFALAWMGSVKHIARIPVTVEGLEHIQAARDAGRGVLLVGAHFSHLELAGRLLTQYIPLAGMYRVHSDAAFEWTIKRARLKYAHDMFTKDEMRQTVRYLKQGGVLWYAPDQDMRGKDAVFVPFFGIPAATITATHHLARLSGACVIPFFHQRLPEGGYVLRLEPPLADFPSADVVADTARVNTCIERMVRAAPAEYLWVHQRFKTRPLDEAPIY